MVLDDLFDHLLDKLRKVIYKLQKYPYFLQQIPVLLYDQRFPIYLTYYNPPLTAILNAPPPPTHTHKNEKTQKIATNTNITNFTLLYTTWVETLPRSMHEFWEQISCVLSDKMFIFLPYGPTKKKMAKIQNLKCCQSLCNFVTDSNI